MMKLQPNCRCLEGSKREIAHKARRTGPADPEKLLFATIRVRRSTQTQELREEPNCITTALANRQYLSRDDFARRYGSAQADLERVEQFARANDLVVIQSNPAHRTVIVSGAVKPMNRAFGVDLGRYESPTQKYRGHAEHIQLPNDVADIVEGVFGLDTRCTARRSRNVIAGETKGDSAVAPQRVAQLYNFPPIPNGIGQETIGILAFSDPNREIGTCGYKPSDIEAFFTTQSGIGPGYFVPRITDVSVNGAVNTPGGDNDIEVTLDVEVAGAVAQGANIAVYFTTWDENGWILALNRAIHPGPGDPSPSVISISWGWSEFGEAGDLAWTKTALDAVSAIFQDAACLGITIVVASGDDGSNCQIDDQNAHVYYPASDPWVLTCGGTSIEEVLGSSFQERTWNKNGVGVTGGGISDWFAIPFWQENTAVPPSVNPKGGRGRGIPDIAGHANGYPIVVRGEKRGPFVGTSATTPLYAGLVAILNATLGQRLGYLNPTLYALGGTAVFRDIADSASNCVEPSPGYNAVKGWDPCTGWGSIDGQALLAALKQLIDQAVE